jgi:hypothetical protein
MSLSRRRFLSHTAAVTAGFAGLRSFAAVSPANALVQASDAFGYGPLIKDRKGLLDLPAGFSYQVISRKGEKMDDGFFVPGKHDGMATFAGPDGLTILVRNHEITGPDNKLGPFGKNGELYSTLPWDRVYDSSYAVGAICGGTTTLVYDTKKQKLVRHFLSLVGTCHNCAGGVTPWGSWISCEESVAKVSQTYEQDHGYNFEVPASAEIGIVKPVPLTAMGRFNHEAVAVDPKSGIIYQTEDRQDGVLYRFIPKVPEKLAEGGRLQFLAVKDKPSLDLRNWKKVDTKKLQSGGAEDAKFEGDGTLHDHTPVGTKLTVYWKDIDDVESPKDDLRYRAFDAGAARFARNEGMWYGNDAVYFASTTGGHNAKGQIWRYTPSPKEGTAEEAESPATLELFIEPNDETILQHADNLCIADFGDVIVCEDGGPVNHVLGVTPKGQVYKLARNAQSKSEFAGSCFSPDGTTMFVNIQNPGLTLAITGPWAG